MNIVITGASKGIGFETARFLTANYSCKVFAISRDRAGLNDLDRTCDSVSGKGIIKTFPFDLLSGRINEVLLPGIRSFMPEINILVNNAGVLVNKPFQELTEADFNLMFGTNVKAALLLSQALVPFMSAGSHIVNIGSMGGFQGSVKFSGLSLYSASKGALAILSECMAEELKDRKISVNCLALGSAQTEMLSQAFPGYKAPLSAHEMAEFIAEFAVRGHNWFNGKVLPVSINTP